MNTFSSLCLTLAIIVIAAVALSQALRVVQAVGAL